MVDCVANPFSEERLTDLVSWQHNRMLTMHLARMEYGLGRDDVTILSYHFWGEEGYDRAFERVECAIRETWLHCGQMKTVVVTNRIGESLERFAKDFPCVKVQVEQALIPGRLQTMSIDCIEKLHTRFDTPYVLIVQNDGFPLRGGLDQFVGKYDYIGAPWVRHSTYYDLYPYRYCVGNGGFSLRSKRVCEEASRYYRKYFKWMPYWWYVLGDDTFYCKTLRFWFPSFRRQFVWADASVASSFSLEHNVEFRPEGGVPFGFHGSAGWRRISEMGIV